MNIGMFINMRVIILLLLTLLLSGCVEEKICKDQKLWDCTEPVNDAWACKSIYSNVVIECNYAKP